MRLRQNELRDVWNRRSLEREFHTAGAKKERLAKQIEHLERQGDQLRKIEEFELDGLFNQISQVRGLVEMNGLVG